MSVSLLLALAGTSPSETSAIWPAPARELELKLEGEAHALDNAFAALDAGSGNAAPARNLTATYFDTPGGALWARGRTLRLRKSQGKIVLTLKWPCDAGAAPGSRFEAETEATGETPDIALFGPDIAGELQEITRGAPLIPRFGTQVRRRIKLVAAGHSKVEVAYDIGHLLDGGEKAAIRELEFELKEGQEADLYELAEQIASAHRLRLGMLTKSQRGFLLAADEKLPLRKAAAPPLDPDMRLDDLIGAAISECLDHFAANWPVLQQSDDPDSIHQMRVGLRRLRAILKVFQRAAPNARVDAFRVQARELANAFGLARDTDVFLDMASNGPLAHLERDAGIEAFLAAGSARREEGYGNAHAMLAAPQTTRFVLEMRGYVARKGWREGLGAEQLIGLGEPAARFAAHALGRLDKKARKRAKKLASLDAEQRHELRIVLKNIRYCADMFGPLFRDANAAGKYARAAASLQDRLGVYNDEAMAQSVVADIERRAGPESARAAGAVLGWAARGRVEADAQLVEECKEFRRAKRFWR